MSLNSESLGAPALASLDYSWAEEILTRTASYKPDAQASECSCHALACASGLYGAMNNPG